MNNQKISIIYFDPNAQSNDLKTRLQEFHQDILCPTTLESAISLVQSIQHQQKMFFITLYSNMSEILCHTEIFHHIHGMFIFYLKNDGNEYIFDEQLNIIGNFHDVDGLCSSIDKEINLINKEHFKWTFFNYNDYLRRNLSKQTND